MIQSDQVECYRLGMANVLLKLSQVYQFDSRTSYSMAKVDVNIFWRLYLVRAQCHNILE